MWRVYFNKRGFPAYDFQFFREFSDETQARLFLSSSGYSIEEVS